MIGTLYPVALSRWNWGPAVTAGAEVVPSVGQLVGGRLHHPTLLDGITRITQWLLWVRF